MEEIGRQTLQENFAKITGSALEPGALAGELFQRKLIGMAMAEDASNPHNSKRDRLAAMVMAVMGNGSPGGFKAFVEAVEKDRSCEWLAKELKALYMSKGGRWDSGTGTQKPQSVPAPTLRELVRLPSFDWYHVGLELELEDDELETISKDNQQDEVKARREFYRLWLRRCADASYQKLVDALYRARHESVAHHVCTKFGITRSAPTPAADPTPPPQPKAKAITAKDTPTIVQLQRFGPKKINIPERIGINYQQFGYFILNDHNGSRVSSITMQCFHNPVNACTEILCQWLQGSGVEERTWGKLVEVLQDLDMNTLADDIESVLSKQ